MMVNNTLLWPRRYRADTCTSDLRHLATVLLQILIQLLFFTLLFCQTFLYSLSLLSLVHLVQCLLPLKPRLRWICCYWDSPRPVPPQMLSSLLFHISGLKDGEYPVIHSYIPIIPSLSSFLCISVKYSPQALLLLWSFASSTYFLLHLTSLQRFTLALPVCSPQFPATNQLIYHPLVFFFFLIVELHISFLLFFSPFFR